MAITGKTETVILRLYVNFCHQLTLCVKPKVCE
jgi:hypothetical protein